MLQVQPVTKDAQSKMCWKWSQNGVVGIEQTFEVAQQASLYFCRMESYKGLGASTPSGKSARVCIPKTKVPSSGSS